MMQIQKANQCIYHHLIRPHPEFKQYLEHYPPQKYIDQITILLREAIHNRNCVKNNQQSLNRKKLMKDVTPKVTEIYQQAEGSFKIYGKPKVILNNDIDCVIHNTDTQQQCRSGINHTKHGKKGEGKSHHIGIVKVLQLKIEPLIKHRHHKHHASNRKVGQISTIRRESNQDTRLKSRNNNNKTYSKVAHDQFQNQHHHHHDSNMMCSCSSDDEQVLQKLESMYDTIKQQHQSRQKQLKTYKITSNFDYTITSSQQDQ